MCFVQRYILQFFRTLIDQQTWTDRGSVSERRLRSEVLSLACHLDDPLYLERAHQSFKEWLHSSGTIQYVCLYFTRPHYQPPAAGRRHIKSSYCLYWCKSNHLLFHVANVHIIVFTLACPLMWQRQCIQLELRTTMAGPHSYTYIICLFLKHRNTRSSLPCHAAVTQTNSTGTSFFHIVNAATKWQTLNTAASDHISSKYYI